MTASEIAFLVIGLVLGVASGAALIEVLRARPPASREIRVTVAPNAISSRLSATLSEPATAPDVHGPARGGPGDRRLVDDPSSLGEPVGPTRRADGGRLDRPAAGRVADRTVVPSFDVGLAGPRTTPQSSRPAPLWLRPAGSGQPPALVAVPIEMEPDPITTALRATAAASAVAAMAAPASRSAVGVADVEAA
ncbi:MAG TPA: hypothetical protein VFI34_03530, partial [Candidatus Limnocylindrales bacterium]|nr:hypothetical protein [Candidatus Limnocylindrales bacterium]